MIDIKDVYLIKEEFSNIGVENLSDDAKKLLEKVNLLIKRNDLREEFVTKVKEIEEQINELLLRWR